jgi:hypothetical protein
VLRSSFPKSPVIVLIMSARTIGGGHRDPEEGRKVSQDEAFALLRSASQRANRLLREIPSAIVQGANLLR